MSLMFPPNDEAPYQGLTIDDYIVNGNDSLVLVEGVTPGSGYHDQANNIYYGVREGKVVAVGGPDAARYPDKIDALIRKYENYGEK